MARWVITNAPQMVKGKKRNINKNINILISNNNACENSYK